MDRRVAGVGSSPTLPVKSERTRLWNRLRKLDREIGKLQHETHVWGIIWSKKIREQTAGKLLKKDRQRKSIRLQLKGYKL